ncbi:2488_t:CDS:2 [Paraglomus occultum]|uniref:2488_t:CDS:1 n=1 Tax=Paraglomus occultum TaxID=144539 RepID=A0A9N9AJJ6_9GLOM|nr:2488_t:CDS:2 [Paraglomus occultum]
MSTPQNATTNDSPGALVAASTIDPHQTAHTMLVTDSGTQDAFSAAATLLRVHEPQTHHQQSDTQLNIQFGQHLQHHQGQNQEREERRLHQQSHSLRLVSDQSTVSLDELQNSLKRVEGLLRQGNLSMAIQILSEITELVVSNCEYLGLSGDDFPSLYRVKQENFWRSLNNTWIYALTQTNVPSKHSTFIDHGSLCHLRQTIINWADVLERYGLVDYELGFWEQDLLEAIDRLLAGFLNQHSCRAFNGEILSQCQPEVGSRVKAHDGELYSHV